MREALVVLTAIMLMLCLTWGVSAMYQAGYADGYGQAKAVRHG